MIDRLPPNSPEAEKCLLGCLLLEPDWVLSKMREVCENPADLFYNPAGRTVVAILSQLVDSGYAWELAKFVIELERRGVLETVGGYGFLSDAIGSVPSARNAGYYLETLGAALSRRRLISTCASVSEDARRGELDLRELLDSAESRFLTATRKVAVAGDSEAADSSRMIGEAMEYAEVRMKGHNELSGYWFDDCALWLPGNMVVLGARPKVGKTTLALNVVAQACARGIPCGMVSMEMPRAQLMLRMASCQSGVDSGAIYRKSGMTEDEHRQLGGAFERMASFPFWCDDRPALNIYQIRTAFRAMKAKHGIKLAVLDYLQLTAASGRDDTGKQSVARISNGLKAIFRELQIPGIVLSQLNRDVERGGKRDPRPSDLRGSGQIEADADAVLLMQTKPDPPEISSEPVVEVSLSYNRHGPTRVRNMVYYTRIGRFDEQIERHDSN